MMGYPGRSGDYEYKEEKQSSVAVSRWLKFFCGLYTDFTLRQLTYKLKNILGLHWSPRPMRYKRICISSLQARLDLAQERAHE